MRHVFGKNVIVDMPGGTTILRFPEDEPSIINRTQNFSENWSNRLGRTSVLAMIELAPESGGAKIQKSSREFTFFFIFKVIECLDELSKFPLFSEATALTIGILT